MGCCNYGFNQEKYELPIDFFEFSEIKEPKLVLENNNEILLVNHMIEKDHDIEFDKPQNPLLIKNEDSEIY
jgi:hypothetical protein